MSAQSCPLFTVFNCKWAREEKGLVQKVICSPRHGLVGWTKDESGAFHEYTYCNRWGHEGWLPTEKYKELRENDKAQRRLMYEMDPMLLWHKKIQSERLLRSRQLRLHNRAWLFE